MAETAKAKLALIEATTADCVIPIRRPGSGQPCLILIASSRPESIGQVFRIDKDECVLGRGSEAAFRIEDPGISRSHAKVVHRPGGELVVVDLGSTNGTYVNGLRVRSATLCEGDRIQIGTLTALRFSLRDELEESEERLRQALAAAGVGTWEWEVRTGHISLSETAERMLRLGSGDPAGPADVWSLVHPDDRRRLEDGLAAVAERGVACDLECRFVAAGGTHRWVSMKGEVFRDEAGVPVRVAGTLMDISNRKQAEQELRRQALMFESLSDGVVVLDLDGAILDWNAAAERMFGHSKVEALGKRPGALLRPGEPDTLTPALIDGIARTGRWSGEIALKRKDRSECLAEVVAMPLRDADGRHLAHIAVHRDIGERKQMQARLQLAERIGSLGTLAAGMAHEINNPLAFITANLVFIQEELAVLAKEAGPARLADLSRAVSETRQGAERIRTLVRDLRAFSHGVDRDDAGRVEVNRVLEFVIRIAENEIRHRARLVKSFGEVPAVEASESRLGQVFLNLVVNAAQAIAEGSAARNEVRVSSAFDAATGRVVVEVADTGAGIAPEHLSRIFDPFFTTKPVGVGTGLGLSICHRIVTALGGEIAVESEVGKGSRFRVFLPATDRPAVARPATTPRPVPDRARILVVDDEPLVATAIERFLAPRHDVSRFTSAAEALGLLDAGERFDVILCDLMMPDVTGMDLHARLAEARPDQAARMVFMTGGAFTERARQFLEGTRYPTLAKPFDLSDLDRMIADVVGAKA
jgi:PAS domain S-box-containing protein